MRHARLLAAVLVLAALGARAEENPAVEVVVKECLPPATTAALAAPYVALLHQRLAAGASLPELKAGLRGIAPVQVAGRIVQGWKRDGNEVATFAEFRKKWAGVTDWPAYHALTYLHRIMAEYQDWRKLAAYAEYYSTAKEPMGLRAWMSQGLPPMQAP